MRIQTFLHEPRGWQRAGIVAACLVFIGLVGAMRYRVGVDLEMGFIFLIPVVISTWYVGGRIGAMMALLSVFMWFGADIAMLTERRSFWLLLFNESTRLLTYLLMVIVLVRLRRAVEIEYGLARSDSLTRLYNRRALDELGQRELDRCARERWPVAILFVDVDDFKAVNDTLGHDAGDVMLRSIAAALVRGTRRSDLVARLGGDEFCVLAAGMTREQSTVFAQKVHGALGRVGTKRRWPISFSIGVAFFPTAPPTIDDAIGAADRLMYEVKRAGKNSISIQTVVPGEAAETGS